ncbi:MULTISPECIES: hypothetical protein [Xenophilus]|uniref:hypothetical protein n=1 Tax=Xenophilus TaxID=151754 RepID=UPI000571A3C6|nr:hypothetical protein [Xenophilus azovorans]
MMIFCRFENGHRTGLDAGDDAEAVGYARGLASAALCLGTRAWVTTSLPDEEGPDNDGWLTPEAWLELNT